MESARSSRKEADTEHSGGGAVGDMDAQGEGFGIGRVGDPGIDGIGRDGPRVTLVGLKTSSGGLIVRARLCPSKARASPQFRDWFFRVKVVSVKVCDTQFPSHSLTKSAINEFEKVAAKAWGGGVALGELLARANRVASKMRPKEGNRDSQVSATFQERSFRHYQTLGGIDSNERAGRRVVYGLRHFTQALPVRRLLLEKVSAERITSVIVNSSTEEVKRILFEGIEMVVR